MFQDLAVYIIAVWIIGFILFCLGLYFLFFTSNNSLSLIISVIVFLSPIVYVAINSPVGDVLSRVGYFSIPFSIPFGIFAAVFDSIRVLQYFFIVIGFVINYLSVFAVVSIISKMFRRILNS